MSFHLKRKFLKKWIFSSNVIKTPQVLKRWSIKNEEREKLLKKRKKGKKKKTPRVSSNKGKVNILRGEKHFNIKNILFVVIPFSPPPSYHFKTLSKIIEKFLAFRG
jgi:hypothetical protein